MKEKESQEYSFSPTKARILIVKHTWRKLELEREAGTCPETYMPSERGSRDSGDEETRNDLCCRTFILMAS